MSDAAGDVRANGSRDGGFMQIDSSCFPLLKRQGVEEHHLPAPTQH